MTVCYELADKMLLSKPSSVCSGENPSVEVLSGNSFDSLPFITDEGRDALRFLTEAESNYVDAFEDCTVGSFAIPDKDDLLSDPFLFGFYLDHRHLVFIDDSNNAERILDEIAQSGIVHRTTTGHVLYLFFKVLLEDDLVFLGKLEDRMEDEEEELIGGSQDISADKIMSYRRASSKLETYYQQVGAMAAALADNENDLMTPEVARSFQRIDRLADRLIARSQAVKEYSLQLHELHQTRIDLKQNSIMQTFTIVTVLFAPLTLVTGWFGMNLTVLPGVDWPYMAIALLAAGVIVTTLILILFRWKRLL